MYRMTMLGTLVWMGALALPPDALAAEPARSAVVVGANRAPPGRVPLRFAHHDARAVRDALVELAGFSPDRVTLLLDPAPAELLAARLRGQPERGGTGGRGRHGRGGV